MPDPALDCLAKSEDLYSQKGIVGFDDKDVRGANKSKVIGASVNASQACTSRGHVLIASPAEKRHSLSWITLQTCQLSHTTDSLHLCLLGGWTSTLIFRRPFCVGPAECFPFGRFDSFRLFQAPACALD